MNFILILYFLASYQTVKLMLVELLDLWNIDIDLDIGVDISHDINIDIDIDFTLTLILAGARSIQQLRNFFTF